MYKKILYPALTLFAAWFFAEGIPIATFSSASGFLSALGAFVFAGLVTLSVFQFVKRAKPVTDYSSDTSADAATETETLKANTDKGTTEGCTILLIILVSLFGYGVFLVFHGIKREENEFKEHGVYAIGTITGGSSYKSRKFDDTELNVTFENKDGEKRTADVEISASEFDKYYEGQQIPIVYSKRNQGMVKILKSNDDINTYLGKNVRDVNLKDLEHVFQLKDQKQVTAYLNTVSPEWTYEFQYADSTATYVNNIKQTGIKITGNEITYMLPQGADSKTFDKEALAQGFEKIEGDKNDIASRLSQERLFVNKDYMLVIRYTQSQPTSRPDVNGGYKYEAPPAIGVVTLIKQ